MLSASASSAPSMMAWARAPVRRPNQRSRRRTGCGYARLPTDRYWSQVAQRRLGDRWAGLGRAGGGRSSAAIGRTASVPGRAVHRHVAAVLKLGGGAQPRAHMRHYLAHMVHEGLVLDRDGLAAWLCSQDYAEKYA